MDATISLCFILKNKVTFILPTLDTPCVLKGFSLGGRIIDDIVIPIGIEWRIKIDQVHRFIGDMVAKDVQVISVI